MMHSLSEIVHANAGACLCIDLPRATLLLMQGSAWYCGHNRKAGGPSGALERFRSGYKVVLCLPEMGLWHCPVEVVTGLPRSCEARDSGSFDAGFHRQCLFGGLRIGMYEPVKTFYMGSSPGEAPFLTKVTMLMVQQINSSHWQR